MSVVPDGGVHPPGPGPVKTPGPPHRSPATSPARKRMKLDLTGTSGDPPALKKKLHEWRRGRLRRKQTAYRDNMAELFFLKNGTNITDNLQQFLRKPSPQFVSFLVANSAPACVVSEVEGNLKPAASLARPSQSYSPHLPTCLPLSPVKIGESQDIFSVRQTASRPSQNSSLPPPSAPVYSPDQVGERTKQEGWVVRRVTELTRDGLWPAKRLPQVAERPRPVTAWDMVLEEMRWMATDFAQERLWKKAAARVQSAAAREHVVRRREQEQATELELASQEHKRSIARHIAEKVAVFWREVSTCYQQQEVRRQELHQSKSLAQQGLIVSSVQPAVSLKRKHSESLTIPAAPLTPESQHENGVISDTESTISEQESWEILNTVADTEMEELSSDNRTELGQLVRSRYPGYEEDLRLRWEEGEEEGDTLSDWDTDSECEETEEDRTVSDTTGLLSLAQEAASLSVRPDPGQAGEAQLDWLLTLHSHNLPALLLSDNKVTVCSLLSHLVTRAANPGPHLLIVPVTAVSSWSSVLARSQPGLSVVQYTGSHQDRRRAREEISLSSLSPNIVLTTYRTFFLDSAWFLTRPWSLLVLTQTQNISAAASDQIRDLASLKAARRLLLASGEVKENPIDLWNTLYLMFPSLYFHRAETDEAGVEVAGTPEYLELKEKLLTIVTGFSYPSCKSSLSQETKLGVSLNPSKQKLYDDYLAQTLSQDTTHRDLRAVTSAVQVLREICNQPLSSSRSSHSSRDPSLPDWCYINKSQSSVFSRVQEYNPLENISLDQVNLVFLSQEMTTTVLTSARLRSIKASKKMIQELSSSSPATKIPRNRLQLNLESLTRHIGGGWNLGGLSLGDGVSLVKAANGQVYKMTVRERSSGEDKLDTNLQPTPGTSGAFHPESLETIASVNHWRCDGFPLYGQDLIRSLEITGSTRPVQSRFRGQGYVNCLNSGNTTSDWRFSTAPLAKMCQTSGESLEEILRSWRPPHTGLDDNKMKALHSVLYPAHREGQKVVLVTGLQSSLPAIAELCNKSGIRYCVVRGGESYAKQMSTVTWWQLEPRMTVLVVMEVESHHATLDLSAADLLVLLDSGPGQWEPELTCPLVRLLYRGTVEESLSRVETVRRVLQDIKTNPGQDGSLSKQTVAEIVSPQPDNGYTKRKEKGLSESDSSVWKIFSTVLGSADPDTGPVQSLLDLAELETLGEAGDGMEDLDEDTVDLVRWLEGLHPIKRYGMRLLRDNVEMRLGLTSSALDIPTVSTAEQEKAKISWERKFRNKQKQEERLEKLENMLTYSQELVEREWKSVDGRVAGVWRPPGQYQADKVPMETVFSGYSRHLIPESQLPPVHVKKENKSAPLPIAGVICQAMSPPTLGNDLTAATLGERDKHAKIKREDQSGNAPKSLFDRPRPPKMVARPRPPFTQTTLSAPVQISGSLSGQFQSLKPLLREVDAGPSWTIQEDQALHQAVMTVQELGLNTTSATNPGHTINWDMVSDMVNSVSWCFRSSKQCRARWESSLVPREEGRMSYDNTPKKMKKEKKLGLKLDKKTSQNMKTGALFRADNNNAFSSTFSGRFETIKNIANKRTPTTTPLLVNPTLRNPKHAAVLAESGIDYDSPVSPVQVAANRADRIQASKARTAPIAPQTSTTTSTTVTTAQTVQAASPRTGSTTVSLPTQPAQAVVVGISQPLSGDQAQQAAQNSAVTSRPALSVQELLKTAAVSSAIMTTTGVALTSTSPRLPTGQILVSQAGKTGLVQTGTVLNRQLTPQQLQLLKQQAIKKNQEQQLKARLGSSSAAASSASVTSAVVGGSSKVTVTGSLPAGLGRGQVIRQNTVRNISDPEFKALLSKQPGVKGNVVQVANSMSAAQLQQLGLQVASSPGTSSSSLVKTVSSPLVQVSPGTSKTLNISGVGSVLQAGQIKAVAGGRGLKTPGQQLQIQKQIQLITGQKVAAGQRVALATTGKPGQPTQLIVPGNKGLPAAVTVQQLQQIVKGAGLAGGQGQVIGTITGQQGQQILSVKPSGNTLPARVIPVSGTAGRGQQTIQVVTQQRQGAPNVTINQMGRPGTASELASALAAGSHVKIQAPQGASQQQILSQISTALAGHGQNVSVAVRTPTGSNTTVLQPATVVQQGQGQAGGQQRQMVNLQLSVAQPVQQTVTTSTNNQQNNSDS